MKIGILGTGIVGRTHATKLAELGHEVKMGTRSVEKTLAEDKPDMMGNEPFVAWQNKNSKVKLVSFDQAAEFAEIIFNVIKGEVVLKAFENLNKEHLNNKVIIDLSNALDFSKGMPPLLLTHDGNSIGEQLQQLLPKSKVVKTLNTLSASLQVNPKMLADGNHQIFMSGNDSEAKKLVETILKSYGWQDILDLGDITTARGTELLMPFWLRLWSVLGTTTFNYKIIK